jgi:signal transduction histidine kinase
MVQRTLRKESFPATSLTHIRKHPGLLAPLLLLPLVVVGYLVLPIQAFRWYSRESLLLIEFILAFILPYIVGLVLLSFSVWLLFMRPFNSQEQVQSIFFAASAFALGATFDMSVGGQFTPFWTIALGISGGALFHLALLTPTELPFLENRSSLAWLATILGAILGLLGTAAIFWGDRGNVELWRQSLLLILGLGLSTFTGLLVYRYLSARSVIVQEQSRILFLGTLLAWAPMLVVALINFLVSNLALNLAWFLPFFIFFPLTLSYISLRYQVASTDHILSQGLILLILGIAVSLGYALLVSGLSLLFGSMFSIPQPIPVGILFFILALLFAPLRDQVRLRVQRQFFGESSAFQTHLQTFSRELTQAIDIPAIADLLRHHIDLSLKPEHIHIFSFDRLSQSYLTPSSTNDRTTELRFPADSGLVNHLASRSSTLYLTHGETLPAPLMRDRARLAILGSVVYVPIPNSEKPAGWIALGERRSAEPYAREDLLYLEGLAYQASLAIARAQVVVDLERRIVELNVLTRIAQAVNFAHTFDDLLELIYAQTNHVIPAGEFRIALFDSVGEVLRYVFLVAGNERKLEMESRPLRRGLGLLSEVAHEGIGQRVDDYAAACEKKNIQPEAGWEAWMAAPLQAEGRTLGALSVGTLEKGLVFTDDQMKILSAISDQAAGAITKARLYQSSQDRTRQLSVLNEAAKTLSRSLEIETLMKNLLDEACGLVHCEAANLILVDEISGELRCRQVHGPHAEQISGKLIPSAGNLTAGAIASAEMIVVDHEEKLQAWGFYGPTAEILQPRNLIIVPLLSGDRAFGAIEVINKIDRADFEPDDGSILSAFASQASIALENARRYQLTDEELNARVEELTVINQVDRALNQTLEFEQTIEITLNFALQISESDAGLIALEEEGKLRLHGFSGYPSDIDLDIGGLVPRDLGAIQRVGESLIAHIQTSSIQSTQIPGLQPDAKSILTIPFIRRAELAGILLLESTKANQYDATQIATLTRLANRAITAIHNAQLYKELQKTNLAKSEFISVVSHELRTPMTSIKGYSDLIAKGNAGEITDMQASFMNTISQNVDRMGSLVSDLADISRIESGRLRLDFESLNLDEIITEVVNSSAEQIRERDQKILVQLQPGLPQVWADRTRLAQILTNLVSNANKYTPPGGAIKIRGKLTENIWDLTGPSHVIHVEIRDSGIGMSEEDQKKVFDKFFRSEDQRVREHTGTGLGLSISQTLIELQGGKMWFESDPGSGSTFHFSIAIVEAPAKGMPQSNIETMIGQRRPKQEE